MKFPVHSAALSSASIQATTDDEVSGSAEVQEEGRQLVLSVKSSVSPLQMAVPIQAKMSPPRSKYIWGIAEGSRVDYDLIAF